LIADIVKVELKTFAVEHELFESEVTMYLIHLANAKRIAPSLQIRKNGVVIEQEIKQV